MSSENCSGSVFVNHAIGLVFKSLDSVCWVTNYWVTFRIVNQQISQSATRKLGQSVTIIEAVSVKDKIPRL
jgi:hypothetical protein